MAIRARRDGLIACGLAASLLAAPFLHASSEAAALDGPPRAKVARHAEAKRRARRQPVPLAPLEPLAFAAPEAQKPAARAPIVGEDRAVRLGDVTITPGGFVALDPRRPTSRD